jgi:hypothetical protein
MTPHALQDLMRRHGILHRELAVITGRTERAVYYWVHGKRPVPRSTELLLLALDEGRIDANWLISKIK